MNKKQLPYLIFGLIFLLAILAQLFIPKPVDWTPSLDGNDKRPLGLFILKQQLTDLFPEAGSQTSYRTLYELQQTDSMAMPNNLLFIGQSIRLDEEDTKLLLNMVQAGHNALLSGHFFSSLLEDTLGISMRYMATYGDILEKDSLKLSFMEDNFLFPRHHLMTAFDSIPSQAEVLGSIINSDPVTLRIPFGKGNFYLNSTPLALTNYYILQPKYQRYAEKLLGLLPAQAIHWTEYYQMGRMESGSPLRYILQQPALKLAYILLMGSVLILLIMGSRRLQRPIPLIEKPKNSSLQFAATLGSLFYRNANHKALAEKRMQHLNEYLHRHYRLQPGHWSPELLSRRTGLEARQAEKLVQAVQHIQHSSSLTAKELLRFNQLLNNCYHQIKQ